MFFNNQKFAKAVTSKALHNATANKNAAAFKPGTVLNKQWAPTSKANDNKAQADSGNSFLNKLVSTIFYGAVPDINHSYMQQAITKQYDPEEFASKIQKYNDPEAINSVVDVFNTRAVKKAYGNANILNRIRAGGKAIYDNILNPLLKGDTNVAAINMLMGVGETVDVVDNILKSQTTVLVNHDTDRLDYDTALEAVLKINSGYCVVEYAPDGSKYYYVKTKKGDFQWDEKDLKIANNIVTSGRTVNPYNLTWDERLLSSIGIGEYGRINYDYVTGSNTTDFMLEVLTGLWDSAANYGADDVGKRAITKSIDIATNTEDIFTASLKQLSNVNRKQLTDEVLSILKNGKVIAETSHDKILLNAITDVALKTEGITQEFAIKNLSDALTYVLAKHNYISSDINTKLVKDLLDRAIAKQVNTMGVTIMKATDSLINAKDKAIKALMYAQAPPVGIYAAAKYAINNPSLFKWISNNLGQIGKANGVTGDITLNTLVDGIPTLEKAERVITDALEMGKIDKGSDILLCYSTIIKESKFLSKILNNTTINNAAKNLNKIKNYLKKVYKTVDLDKLISDAEKFYMNNPDYVTQYYHNILKQTKIYMEEITKYLDAFRTKQTYADTINLVTTKLLNPDTLNMAKNNLLLNLYSITQAPIAMRHSLASKAAFETSKLFDLVQVVPSLKNLNIANAETLYKEVYQTLLKGIDDVSDVIDIHKINDAVEAVALKGQNYLDILNNAIKQIPAVEFPKSVISNTLQKVQKGTITAYDLAKEVLDVLNKAGVVVDLSKLDDAEVSKLTANLLSGHFDMAQVKLENAMVTDYLLSCEAYEAFEEVFGVEGSVGSLLNKLRQLPNLTAAQKEALDVLGTATAAQKNYENLLKNLQSLPNMTPQKFEAFKQAMQNFVRASKKQVYFDVEGFVKRIQKSANNFIGAKNQKHAYTVDAFLKDNLEEVNALRASLGLKAITEEEHTALSDTITQYVLYKQLVANNPELASKKCLVFDLESTNVTTKANTNNICQIGLFNDSVHEEYTLSKQSFDRVKDIPSESFMRSQLNDNVSDYNTLVNKWINTRFVDNGFKTDEDMLASFLNKVYEQARDTWDGKAYHFNLVAHNGNNFDFALLKSKIRFYLNNGGLKNAIDPYILYKIDLVDTLEMWHKADGWDIFEASDLPALQSVMFEYVNAMQTVNSSFFTAFDYTYLYNLEAALKVISPDTMGVTDALITKEVFEEAQSAIIGLKTALKSVKDANANLSKYAINLNKLSQEGLDLSDFIRYFSTKGVSAEELQQRLKYATKDGKFNLSALLYSTDEFNSLGWKTMYRSSDMLTIFDTATLTELDIAKLKAMNEFAQSTKRTAERIPLEYLDEYSIQDMRNILLKLKTILNTEYSDLTKSEQIIYESIKQISFFNNIKVDINDPQSLAAVFKNILAPIMSKDSTAVQDALLNATESSTSLQALLKSSQYDTDIMECWLTEDFGGSYDILTAYHGVWYSFLQNQLSLREVSKTFDSKDVANAATQARLSAMQPTATLIEDFNNFLAILHRDAKEDVIKKRLPRTLSDMRSTNVKNILNYVFDANTNLEHWLASSGGFVIFDDYNVFKNLDIANLSKQNIKAVDLGNNKYIVYLTKQANYTQYLDTDANGISKVIYAVNGKEYERFNWGYTDFSFLNESLKPYKKYSEYIEGTIPGLVQATNEASKSVAFISGGAAGASTLEHMNIHVYEHIKNLLPQSVIKDMPDAVDSVLFQSNTFNHAVIGSPDLVKIYMGQNTDDPIKMLCKADISVAQESNTINVYTAAMLSESNKLSNTYVSTLIQSSPKDAVKWSLSHPEYTCAKLIPANNKLGYKVIKYEPRDIIRAVSTGAHILPTNTYDKIYKVINSEACDNAALKAYNAVERLYKVGYLMRFGTWLNNSIDAFLKTIAETKGSPIALIKEYANAVRLYSDFDNVTKTLIQNIPPDITFSDFIKSDYIKNYFKTNKFALDYDTYIFYYKLLQESAAGGEIATLSKYSDKLRIDYLRNLQNNTPGKSNLVTQAQVAGIKDRVFATALYGMNYTETIARIAQFNLCTKQGKFFTEAIDAVSRTQFNYDNKSDFEKKMEFVIPFYTFMHRNTTFWLDMCTKNPRFFESLQDVLAPTWNLDQYSSEELENNTALQNAVLNGYIPLPGTPAGYLKTNFSFMDTLSLITAPTKTLKQGTYFPIQAVVNVALQGVSDATYHAGEEVVSNWIQNYFGTKPTEAQLKAKYGEWYSEYEKLYNYKISSENPMQQLADEFLVWEAVPLVGTIIKRYVNSGMYYAEEPLKAVAYATGVYSDITRFNEEEMYNAKEKKYNKVAIMLHQDVYDSRKVWKELCEKYGIDPNQNIYSIEMSKFEKMYSELINKYEFLKDGTDDTIYMYSRLKWALGYKDTKFKDLPKPVQNLIIQTLSGEPITDRVLPVLQDNYTVLQLWKSAAAKHGIANTPWDKVPTSVLNDIYQDITKSCVLISDIHQKLKEDENARATYAITKKNLGYGDLKLNQLPNEALEVIKFAIDNQIYGNLNTKKPNRHTSGGPRPGGTSNRTYKSFHKPYPVTTPNQLNYKMNKQLWANYAHNNVHKHRHRIYEKQYLNSVTMPGTVNKFKNKVNNKISPTDLKYRIKDMYYYLH